MQKNKGFSFKKLLIGGFLVLCIYFLATFLYAKSVPESSGLAGGFAIAYFAILLALFFPVIGIFIYIYFQNEADYIKKEVKKELSPQKEILQKQPYSSTWILLIMLFPLLFLILMFFLTSIFSFRFYSGTRSLEPRGDYKFIIPGDSSNIRQY